MDDFDLFRRTLTQRLDDLRDFIINEGDGIEMGRNPEWVREQFEFTKMCLFGSKEKNKK